ncbi:MAG: AAA family ATPase, partial [Lachnospira sp.]|nr:AAA family ATPase [Lachnospira sp.]
MQYQDKARKIRENISKVIIGKEEVTDYVLVALLAGGHILLEDVPGTGKTMLAKTFAKSIDAKFSRIQFTPDLLPSDVTGINYYNQKESAFVFREGPIFANIILADEINRATPRTQSALLECMEEAQVTVDGKTSRLDAPFVVLATQNPIETAGTYQLPE